MEPHALSSRRSILRATVVAALVAAIILVVAVLPAEYDIDPLGAGAALGLTALARAGREAAPATGTTPATLETVRQGVNAPQSGPMKHDRFEVELRPFEGIEYKYRMEKNAALLYSWNATEAVKFEFHGEPDGAPDKYFESYEKAETAARDGSFLAPSMGIHGWFWKNTGPHRVKVTLVTSGFYGNATEFRDGDKITHTIK